MREVVLVGERALSPTVRSLTFECSDGATLDFVPGQWVNLHVPIAPGRVEKRAYSIASAPNRDAPGRFELAVTRVEDGVASRALHAIELGARLGADGPHGFFTREGASGEPAVFVGTGTGVCPLRSMITAELAQPDGPPLALLFGCRSEVDVLYRDEFEALAAASTRFSLHVTLSRPSAGWGGLTGYVQTHLLKLIDRQRVPHVYVCGLSRMVGEVRRVLKDELGYDRKHIHSERYD